MIFVSRGITVSRLTVRHRSLGVNTQRSDFTLCNHYDLQTRISSNQQYINAVHILVAKARTKACMQICRCAHQPPHFHTSCVCESPDSNVAPWQKKIKPSRHQHNDQHTVHGLGHFNNIVIILRNVYRLNA